MFILLRVIGKNPRSLDPTGRFANSLISSLIINTRFDQTIWIAFEMSDLMTVRYMMLSK